MAIVRDKREGPISAYRTIINREGSVTTRDTPLENPAQDTTALEVGLGVGSPESVHGKLAAQTFLEGFQDLVET